MKNGHGFKIDKNIPVPSGYTERRTGISAALRSLKVGESILFKGKTRAGIASLGCHVFGPGGCTTRLEDGGIRLWRVK